jgi:L-ribulose-5-phosphate 4-epimerase
MSSTYQALKEACFEANIALNNLGLVIYTFGNVSAVDRDKGVFAIKPSGVAYEKLRPEDMVILDYDNTIIEGTMRPSSDTKTHAFMYKNWDDIGGIAHTHATYSVAWAQAQRDIPIFGTTHADHLTADIPCASPMGDALIEGDYEHNTGIQIIDCFKERGLSPKKWKWCYWATMAHLPGARPRHKRSTTVKYWKPWPTWPTSPYRSTPAPLD